MPHLDPIPASAPASDLLRSEATEQETEAMARATVRLFSRWQLTDPQATVLLGEMSPRTWARWKRGETGRIGVDLRTRLSNLMGIHKALRLIFIDPEQGYAWVKRENLAFDGQSALDVMLQGQLTDLMRVRRYLDNERGA